MRKQNLVVVFTAAVLLLNSPVFAQQNTAASLQGYSGLINVPNAYVIPYGTGSVQYADQFIINNEYLHNNNFMVNLGVFPHLEISNRLSWFDTHTSCWSAEGCGIARDLSTSIKLNIPFIPKNWLSLAVGEQDTGGEANFFDAKYIVASREFGDVRIDLGVGDSSEGRYLHGEFGGLSYQPFEWLSLMAEYDAQDTNVGFRLSNPISLMPKGWRVDLTVLLDTDNEKSRKHSFYSLALNVPFGSPDITQRHEALPRRRAVHDKKEKKDASREKPISRLLPETVVEKKSVKVERLDQSPAVTELEKDTEKQKRKEKSIITSIVKQLKSHDFERLGVGVEAGYQEDGRRLVITFENNTYNHNELDAIGVALGVAAKSSLGHFSHIELILKNEGLAMLGLIAETADYVAFLDDQIGSPLLTAFHTSNARLKRVQWLERASYGTAWRPRISLSPSLGNTLGTELGVYDYTFGLRTDLSVSLWRGALVHASYLDLLDESEDFLEGRDFYKYGDPTGFRSTNFQQAFKLHPQFLTVFDAGRLRYHYDGGQNKSVWSSKTGRHQFSARYGRYRLVRSHISKQYLVKGNEHPSNVLNKDIKLLSYRYYWPRYDISFKITHGTFWIQDEGSRVDVKFRFGDTTWALLYKSTDVDMVGLYFEVPLTPRRDFNHKYLQVKGKSRWRYGVQTQINNEQNFVNFEAGDLSRMEKEVDETFLNGDRLEPEYIYHNLRRLKSAYSKYVLDSSK